MNSDKIPFQKIDWKEIKPVKLAGETGFTNSKEVIFRKSRIRIVKYSKNYLADHWCKKGHIVYCLKGRVLIKLKSGKKYIINTGDGFRVGDGIDSHRVFSKSGGTLLIID